jgi:hypothetical protein
MERKIKNVMSDYQIYIYQFPYKGNVLAWSLKVAHRTLNPKVPWNTV